ncbi:MAG: Fic family protein [Mycoplasmataceae bacterium]|nr:Fic family protein [Mycoplasmataceae bacterium]
MKTFNYHKLKYTKLSMKTLSYIAIINKYVGKFELFNKQKPELLTKLNELAKIQSIDFSNKIEGISTNNSRLRKIVEDEVKPKTRDEKEIAGYRDALDIIYTAYDIIKISPNYILQLHKILFSHSEKPHQGKFKNVDNYIQEKKQDGSEVIRFKPLSFSETPNAIEQICEQYNNELKKGEIEKLILIINFILDFLCIHPFIDGNGRLSRILTLLLMLQNGYFVGKYISIEKIIDSNKDMYYETLKLSSKKWYYTDNDSSDFIDYMLFVISEAYKTLEKRSHTDKLIKKTKPQMVKELFDNTLGWLTKQKIMEHLPMVSKITIEKTLSQLLKSGYIRKDGINKLTKYIKT